MDRQLADILGNTVENVLALIFKISAKNKIGVANKINIAGTNYRYELIASKEYTPTYKRMEQRHQEGKEMSDED